MLLKKKKYFYPLKNNLDTFIFKPNYYFMKKFTFLVLAALCFYACKSSKKDQLSGSLFSFEVVKDSTDFINLPALQSFVFATADSGKYWLIFGGRTNGFHGFGKQENFPFKKANQFIYVYNTQTHKLDSMSVSHLPVALQEQYTSSNMDNRQVDSFLYVCGGYGEIHQGTPKSAWLTYATLSRVNVNQMVAAVLKPDTIALQKSVVYDTSAFVQSTGGELYKFSDGKFYLAVGHNFSGKYADTDPSSPNYGVQVYLDAVHVFTLTETSSSIKINTASFQTITDGLPDSVTQFRRRDLNVVPAVLSDGNSYGLTIYGGVFTYTPGCPTCSQLPSNPFRYPIYITDSSGNKQPSYTLDNTYFQKSNIYSAPNLTMYDATNNRMFTTIFGGLGDTLVINQDSAAFTKFIVTLNRDYKQNQTSPIYNPFTLPDYVGAEGVFVPSNKLPIYNNNSFGIIDYSKLPTVSNTLVGYIYGGILSDSTQWNNTSAPRRNVTHPSNSVYKVYMTKL